MDISKFWNLNDFDRPISRDVYEYYFEKYGKLAHNGAIDDGKKYCCPSCNVGKVIKDGFIEIDYRLTGRWKCSSCSLTGGLAQILFFLMDLQMPQAISRAAYLLDIYPDIQLGVYVKVMNTAERYLVTGVAKDSESIYHGQWQVIARKRGSDFPNLILFPLDHFFVKADHFRGFRENFQFIKPGY